MIELSKSNFIVKVNGGSKLFDIQNILESHDQFIPVGCRILPPPGCGHPDDSTNPDAHRPPGGLRPLLVRSGVNYQYGDRSYHPTGRSKPLRDRRHSARRWAT